MGWGQRPNPQALAESTDTHPSASAPTHDTTRPKCACAHLRPHRLHSCRIGTYPRRRAQPQETPGTDRLGHGEHTNLRSKANTKENALCGGRQTKNVKEPRRSLAELPSHVSTIATPKQRFALGEGSSETEFCLTKSSSPQRPASPHRAAPCLLGGPCSTRSSPGNAC